MSHKLRSLWAGPYRVNKLIAPSLAEIKPVYYPGEEKIVGLDVLKLYHGEDVIRQAPAEINPDLWIDEEELTELPEVPVEDREIVEPCLGPDNPAATEVQDSEVPMILDSPEEMELREGIHERIQAEMHHEAREEVVQAEERLESPPAWNEVEDLMLEDGEILVDDIRTGKRSREETFRGRRKRRKEDDICAEKREHSPSVVKRTRNPEGFYSEYWDDDQQEEDQWQIPDKFQRISHMVFRNGVLERYPVSNGVLSSHCVQHQGGGCSVSPIRIG